MAWNPEDEDDDEGPDPEGPDATEMNDDPGEVACPYCQRHISEDADRCPFCGSYVHVSDHPRRREWWWIAALVLLILLLLAYFLRH
jgi:uncharacterized paraquat-inducible protein A